MKIISPTTRIAFGLVSLSFSVSMTSYTLGLFPDREQAIVDGRAALAENVALHCTLLASRNDSRTMAISLEGLVERNKDVESAAIRQPGGSIMHSFGAHADHWNLPPDGRSTRDQMRVPILSGNSQWGVIELRFHSQTDDGLFAAHPFIRLLVFFMGATAILFFIFLQRTFRQFNPSRFISPSVRQAVDSLAEGLLVLDHQGNISLANSAFAKHLGMEPEQLTGRKASELPFETDGPRLNRLPWERALEEGEPQLGELLTLRCKDQETRVLKVNASPVFSEDDEQKGVMISFGDVTQIETSRIELRKVLGSISEARDEIQEQNAELERLASVDSLTGCLNRRAFFAAAESQWSTAKRHHQPLACIMVNLDHFKSVNDTHGHQLGDIVLQKAAHVLRVGRRPVDLVCRFGGGEFCILLPQTDLDGAAIVAEKIRAAIEVCNIDSLSITASLGVSARSMGAGDTQQLIDQADQCLRVAKDEDRNCVVRFDQATEQIANLEHLDPAVVEGEIDANRPEPSVPFDAVTALVSALAYRDPATGDHSRRVADLCAATSDKLMSPSDGFVLETAALLHDIGKLGVPDEVLLKPDKLTDAEMRVMKCHERIGVEIVNSTFSNRKLAEIIRTYRAWFGGSPQFPDLPRGKGISLAARILAVADAYDSMTHQSVYREPFTHEQALDELRRCSGQQFDPEIVERFTRKVTNENVIDSKSEIGESMTVALSFGNQIERLVESLQRHDFVGFAALAERLNLTAAQSGQSRIAEVASRLQVSANDDPDINDLTELTDQLLDLCCLAKRAHQHEAGDGVGPEVDDELVSSETTSDAVPLSENFFSPSSDAS